MAQRLSVSTSAVAVLAFALVLRQAAGFVAPCTNNNDCVAAGEKCLSSEYDQGSRAGTVDQRNCLPANQCIATENTDCSSRACCKNLYCYYFFVYPPTCRTQIALENLKNWAGTVDTTEQTIFGNPAILCPSPSNPQTTSVTGPGPYAVGPITITASYTAARNDPTTDFTITITPAGSNQPAVQQQSPTSFTSNGQANGNFAYTLTFSGISLPHLGNYAVGIKALTYDGCSFTLQLNSVGSAGAVMDPHFTGFHGERFDFHGYGGAYFNLLSDPQHQLNAKFAACSGEERFASSKARYCADFEHEVNGTVMREFGLVHKDDAARVWLEDSGTKWSLRAEAGGMEMLPGEEIVRPGGTTVQFQLPDPEHHAHEVFLTTPTYRFQILHWIDAEWQTDNLDVRVDLLQMPALHSVHGIIGQTLFATPMAAESTHDVKLGKAWLLARDVEFNSTNGLINGVEAPKDTFAVEGQDRDYQVSSVYGHDSAFNRFTHATVAAADLPAVESRRRLLKLDGKRPILSAYSELRKF